MGSDAIRLGDVRTAFNAAMIASGDPQLANVTMSINAAGTGLQIDDANGVTVAAASTLEKDLRGSNGSNIEAATAVGKLIAERAKAAGIEAVVFDRGGNLYHGRVKAIAESAREAGLTF